MREGSCFHCRPGPRAADRCDIPWFTADCPCFELTIRHFRFEPPCGKRVSLVARLTILPSVDVPDPRGYIPCMRPVDIQQIGDELAIKWDDGHESFLRLEVLRRNCPCAGCQGEVDVMGHIHGGGNRPRSPAAVQLRQLVRVGGYALQPVWGDGHSDGLFTFDHLDRLAQEIPGSAG